MLDLSARKVYGALEDGISAIDAKVDNAILSIYKAGGSLEFDDLPSPSSDVANMAYLVTDAFTTTSDFAEGAGVDYPAGTYVAIVNTGTGDDPDYKYDVVPFTMVVDDTMSAVSENPLQNKVITGAVQEIKLDISNLSASKISKSETVGHVMNDGSIDENDYAEKVENATSGHLAGLDSNGNLTDSGVSPTEDVTVEGNPVTFDSPFEQDAKSVVVSVKPIQAGSGTPSPENIRPISGIDEVEIEVSDGESEPTTTTIPLPSTLYGGTVDVTNGSGTATRVIKQILSSDIVIASSTLIGRYLTDYNYLNDEKDHGEVICNAFKGMPYYSSDVIGECYISSNHQVCFVTSFATMQAFQDWIDNNPLYVCYEFATPTTISLTPTDVELLEGTNVFTTNAEKVAVKYGRSLWQDIDKLKTDAECKLDKSDVADVEGDTASKAYSVNDFMLRADGFYQVTAPIASGASITASNTTKTTIGAVLTALLNA